ncbi:hypothetical protein CR513_41184, partial [Mucuna pruriens]
MQFQQNLNATIQDLKMQVGQLANISVGSGNLPSQTIPNPKGDVSNVSLRSGRELPQQPTPQPKSKSVNAEFEPKADSLARAVPLPFPTRTVLARKSKLIRIC